MSLYPLMIEGGALRALVVGGGRVAVRKAHALLEAGARVRVVAPDIDAALVVAHGGRLTIDRRSYESTDIGDAHLVIAATSSREVNTRVARDAKAAGRLANVADRPDDGNCATPAVHREGMLVIAVATGGVPPAAARIRDCIARRFGAPYGAALRELAALRARLLLGGERTRWREIASAVIDDRFCDAVDRGEIEARVAVWR